MSMSKRQFEAIAAIIKRELDDAGNKRVVSVQAIGRIADELADLCQRENGNFNRDRFMQACGFKWGE